jgi:tRNA-intron endonuclease
MAETVGSLRGGLVMVDNAQDANRLYSRHGVGSPQPGNALALSLVEAAWCVEGGRLSVSDGSARMDVADLLERGAQGSGRTEVGFLAYRDLRERGLVVRHTSTPGGFEVWQRGEAPPKPAWFTLQASAERDPVAVRDLAAWAGLGCVLGVVDEDGGLTYYQTALADPQGEVPEARLPPAQGILLDDRVLVNDKVAAQRYGEMESLGTRIGERLVLSLTEAEALRRRGVLSVPSRLVEQAKANQPHFERALPVFMDLRRRGVVAKSGLKFGTHLRAYRGHPDKEHAEWLIHCATPDSRLSWGELARAVRVAHGVRKELLVAMADTGVRYLTLQWFRP